MFENLFKRKKNLVIIAGASRFGSGLAGILCDKGYEVVVIDKDKNAFCKLPDSFSGLTFDGDASDSSVLELVNIKQCIICIASTNFDTTNSLIAQIAGKVYNVPNVYVRMNDTANNTFLENSNVHIICPYELCIREFERQNDVREIEA